MLRVGDAASRVVVLDNASLHVSKVTKAARPWLAKVGIYLYYLPPYSPDLNPIEKAFAELKSLLRKAAKRTIPELEAYLGEALDAFSPEECANYFRSCGYPATSELEPL